MELLTRRKSRAGGNAVLAAGRFVLNKGVKLIALLLAVSAVSFTLVQYSPIDPVQAYIGADMMRVSPEQREAIAAYWGLDKLRWNATRAGWLHWPAVISAPP